MPEESIDPTAQEVIKTLQDAQPIRADAQASETQRREEMIQVMTDMKTVRERVGNFCTTIPADPNIPTSQEALLFPLTTHREDRSKGVNQWGQGKFFSSNVVVAPDGYWITETEGIETPFDRDFGKETKSPQEIVYRTLSDAEAVVNPASHERLVGHVLHVPGTNYGVTLHPATTEDVVNALGHNIKAAQAQHRPALERAQADIATTQAVRQTLEGVATALPPQPPPVK